MAKATNDEGVQKVMVVPGQVDRKMFVIGRKFSAVINSTKNDDYTFSQTIELQGIEWVEVSGRTPGDYMELFILAPTNQVIGQFGYTVYIPPSGKMQGPISEGTVSFPTGYKVRASYTSVATTGDPPEVYLAYRMRK